jgi:hypothetical protein
MRFFVDSGKERDAAELLRTAEIVPGVNPTYSATVLRVTGECLLLFLVFARGLIQRLP